MFPYFTADVNFEDVRKNLEKSSTASADNTATSKFVPYKDFFLAEYNSLRGEIQLRISHQTTLYQTAIAAFGVILTYGLEKIDLNSYSNVYLILVYPLLAYFISFAWGFNNTRICQIAEYLKKREDTVKASFDCLGWENYIHNIDLNNKEKSLTREKSLLSEKSFKGLLYFIFNHFTGTNKLKPGTTILLGTQAVSFIIAGLLFLLHVHQKPYSLIDDFGALIFLLVDLLVISLTYTTLNNSGKDEIIMLKNNKNV